MLLSSRTRGIAMTRGGFGVIIAYRRYCYKPPVTLCCRLGVFQGLERQQQSFNMGGEGWLFLFSVLMAAVLLFTMVFFIIMFSDLECDYINPIDLCNKLNQFVLPEMIAHAFLTLLFLLFGQWLAFLLNVPLVAFNVNKVMSRNHMYDATEIFRTLPGHKKESFIKLGFYLVSFFYYLYRMILALITESD